MKRIFCLAIVLVVLVGCFASCDLAESMQGIVNAVGSKVESGPKVEEMMDAMSEGRKSDAKELLHPDVADDSDKAIDQMSAFLADRKVEQMELKSVNLNTSNKGNQEEVVYEITLDDGDIFYVKAVYLSNDDGEGFTDFQFVLGMI